MSETELRAIEARAEVIATVILADVRKLTAEVRRLWEDVGFELVVKKRDE